MNRSTSLFRSSLLITLLSLISIGLGLATQIILSRWFGAGVELDAYFASSSVPNLFALVLTSSLTIVFVPVFLTYESQDSTEQAWRVAGSFLNLLILVLGIISILGVLLAPLVVRFLVPGHKVESLSYELVMTMFRIQWPIILFSGINGVLSGIYYTQSRFARPAAAPVINSGCTLLFTLLLRQQVGIVSTAIGSLIGPIVQTALLLPILINNDHYRLHIDWQHPGLRQVGKLMLPWVSFNALAKGTSVLDTVLTSTLPAGSLSYLSYSSRLVSLTVNLISRGTALSVFPRISRSHAASDPASFRLYFSIGIRFIGILAIPATGALIAVREPLMRMLFERGLFTSGDTTATGLALAVYATALTSLAFGSIVSNTFYARHDTLTPALIGFIGILLQAGLAFLLIPYLSYLAMAVSFSVLACLKLSTMVYLLWRRTRLLDGRQIVISLSRMVLAALLMYSWLTLALPRVEAMASTATGLILRLVPVGLIALAIYVFALFLLRSPELAILGKRFCGRILARDSV